MDFNKSAEGAIVILPGSAQQIQPIGAQQTMEGETEPVQVIQEVPHQVNTYKEKGVIFFRPLGGGGVFVFAPLANNFSKCYKKTEKQLNMGIYKI